MSPRTFLTLSLAALFAAPVFAKTDIGGCTSAATRNQFQEASMIYWVPDTCEICDFLDCGGGRAPPKTDVPGCPGYKGISTYQPSYLSGPMCTTAGDHNKDSSSKTAGSSMPSKTPSSHPHASSTMDKDSGKTTQTPSTTKGLTSSSGPITASASLSMSTSVMAGNATSKAGSTLSSGSGSAFSSNIATAGAAPVAFVGAAPLAVLLGLGLGMAAL